MDEVRDIRAAGFHWAHNDVLDRLGPVVGAIPMAVYYALCRFADRDGQCHPSHAVIAKRLGMSKRGVINALAQLEGAGAITIQRRRDEAGDKDPNLYTLIGGSAPDALPSECGALPGAPDALGVVHVVHQGSAPRAHKQEPLNNNQLNNNRNVVEEKVGGGGKGLSDANGKKRDPPPDTTAPADSQPESRTVESYPLTQERLGWLTSRKSLSKWMTQLDALRQHERFELKYNDKPMTDVEREAAWRNWMLSARPGGGGLGTGAKS